MVYNDAGLNRGIAISIQRMDGSKMDKMQVVFYRKTN